MLAKLLKYVSNQLDIRDITAWSDSSITLCWLRKAPSALKSFVANRVTAINDLLPDITWRHISSNNNPADLLSRGVTATHLQVNNLWWDGPPWLTSPPECWPMPQFIHPKELPEVRAVILMTPSSPETNFRDSFSSYSHLIFIYSWVRRFIANCRLKIDQRLLRTSLTTEKCKTSSHWLSRRHFLTSFKSPGRSSHFPVHILYTVSTLSSLMKVFSSSNTQTHPSFTSIFPDEATSPLPPSEVPPCWDQHTHGDNWSYLPHCRTPESPEEAESPVPHMPVVIQPWSATTDGTSTYHPNISITSVCNYRLGLFWALHH